MQPAGGNRLGVTVDLDALPVLAGVSLEQWLCCFPCFAFLDRVMIARALDAGTPAAWVISDEVYGGDPGLRADLERRQTGYVLAVAAAHKVITAAGACPARAIAAGLPRRAWQRYSAGEGAKGYRYYDWAWLAIDPGRPDTAAC